MDTSTLAGALLFLQSHGYFIMFVLMFFEGPIITYVAAFAASLGFFNIYAVAILAILGNTLGDIPYYVIGRLGKRSWLRRHLASSIGKKMFSPLQHGFHEHTGKTLALVKIMPGFPIPGLVLAGISEVPFWRFLWYVFLIAIPWSLLFVLLGFYSGVTFTTLNAYLNLGAIIVLVVCALAVVAWFLIRWLLMKFGKKMAPL